MGLLDEVEQSLKHNGPTCSFMAVDSALSPADRKDLAELLANEQKYPATKIGEALRRKLGMKISDETVRRHRRGLCACPR